MFNLKAVSSRASSLHQRTARYLSTRDGIMFDKILIANRGEIACRIMRTARKLGVKSVAVYGDADAGAQHVAMADESYRLGPSPGPESYLVPERIIEACKKSGAQAVHPGYGFLSENADFAAALEAEGIKFIGPPADSIRSMGSKANAKVVMTNAGVPVTPGYWGEDISLDKFAEEAKKIGYPVMLKAVRGGGGKGMRVVHNEKELAPALEACQREAATSFGSSAVLVEKFLPTPRHVEFQVFADSHGNAVHLLERDCSVQRRHQKVLEEAPAPFLSEATRSAMGHSAVQAALAVGYQGAGTVEFMLDPDAERAGNPNSYYFMEMNTRLQVEHPVTELITGLDLVEWQLRIAAGQKLPITDQAQIRKMIRGHALEARVYAENPSAGFLPATGLLKHLVAPTPSANVRVDTGVRQGDSVTIFYDPMISKLITYGETRDEAIKHMSDALSKYQIIGLPNNLSFLQKVSTHPGFVAGGVNTSFLGQHLDECLPTYKPAPPTAVAMGALAVALKSTLPAAGAANGKDAHSPWAMGTYARPTLPAASAVTVPFVDTEAAAAAQSVHFDEAGVHNHARAVVTPVHKQAPLGASGVQVPLFNVNVGSGADAKTLRVGASLVPADEEAIEGPVVKGYEAATRGRKVPGIQVFKLNAYFGDDANLSDNIKATVVFSEEKESTDVYVYLQSPLKGDAAMTLAKVPGVQFNTKEIVPVDPIVYRFSLPKVAFNQDGGKGPSGGSVLTPMPGKVVKVLVNEGDDVEADQPLVILEAMKMEHVIKATKSGVISKVHYTSGEFVEDGRELISIGSEDAKN